MAKQRTEQAGQKGRGQHKAGRGAAASAGSASKERSTEELKRQARNAEAEHEKGQKQEQEKEHKHKQKQGGQTNGATHMPDASRQMAEDFADRSRQQIDRYERAFGEFWKVAESEGFVPLTKGVAKANMEIAGLASRRAKAYVEFPVDLTRCETPQDVVNRQMRFWSDMLRDYQATLGRVTRNWADSANPQQLQQLMQETSDQIRESISGMSRPMGQSGTGHRRGGGRE